MHKTKWIFDTVVLSNFALADALGVLEKRYRGKGLLTWEVFGELSAGYSDLPKLKEVQTLVDQNTFEITSLQKTEIDIFTGLVSHLGKGEASCIAVAKKRNYIVMTDDRAARSRCPQSSINYSGTIGILKAASLEKQIKPEQADKILHQMTAQGFFSPVRKISDLLHDHSV